MRLLLLNVTAMPSLKVHAKRQRGVLGASRILEMVLNCRSASTPRINDVIAIISIKHFVQLLADPIRVSGARMMIRTSVFLLPKSVPVMIIVTSDVCSLLVDVGTVKIQSTFVSLARVVVLKPTATATRFQHTFVITFMIKACAVSARI